MARFMQGLIGDAGFLIPGLCVSSHCGACGTTGTQRGGERFFDMMRPDHLYFAMLMTKHATLAGALIYGVKIMNYAVRTLLV